MSTPEQQQIASLTDKLNALENESRRILRALNWATKVRMILFFALLLFVLISAFLFYRLYSDIRHDRIAEVQRIIAERPEEFSEPLTLQLKALAEQEGPYVAEVFREQAEKDSERYADAFEAERDKLISNLQTKLEEKMVGTYAKMLDEQEQALKDEFPVLKDPEKLANIRANMEKVYDKIHKRYYVEYLREELDELTTKLDSFPITEPRQVNIPISEQIATEFLELVRMMLVYADHYEVPMAEIDDIAVNDTASTTADEDSEDDSRDNSEKSDEKAEEKKTDDGAKDASGDDSKKADDDNADDASGNSDSNSGDSDSNSGESDGDAGDDDNDAGADADDDTGAKAEEKSEDKLP